MHSDLLLTPENKPFQVATELDRNNHLKITNSLFFTYREKIWWGRRWRIDSFRAFGERRFGELIDQPIDY